MLNLKEKFKKLEWWDIGLVKIGMVFFTLLLIKVFPELNTIDWKISAIIVAGIWIYLFHKIWIKK